LTVLQEVCQHCNIRFIVLYQNIFNLSRRL